MMVTTEVDIDLLNILHGLDEWELEEVIDEIVKIAKSKKLKHKASKLNFEKKLSQGETIFKEKLDKILDNYYRLDPSEEKIIEQISKRF